MVKHGSITGSEDVRLIGRFRISISGATVRTNDAGLFRAAVALLFDELPEADAMNGEIVFRNRTAHTAEDVLAYVLRRAAGESADDNATMEDLFG